MSRRFSRSTASIFAEMSMPVTRTPASARGTAMRPVPMPTSSSRGDGDTSRAISAIASPIARAASGGMPRVSS